MKSYIQALQGYLHGLVSAVDTPPQSPVQLVMLENVAKDSKLMATPLLEDFLAGIEVNANTTDVTQLRLAGWEDDIWVLLLCYAWLSLQDSDGSELSLFARLTHEYDQAAASITEEPTEQVDEMLSLVKSAAIKLPSSLWSSSAWSAAMISRVGGRIFKNESFVVPLPDEHGQAEMRVVLCVPNAMREPGAT